MAPEPFFNPYIFFSCVPLVSESQLDEPQREGGNADSAAYEHASQWVVQLD